MKKLFFSILLLVSFGVFYLIYQEYSFTPLKENDFQKLFGKNVKFNKLYSKDFIGLSLHGELFEIYKYNIKDAIIDKNYPKITEWEHQKITNEVIISKWRNCPLDSQSLNLYKTTLEINNDIKSVDSFYNELFNPQNYYSYICFEESNQYFLLYCTQNHKLYYIRRKGF